MSHGQSSLCKAEYPSNKGLYSPFIIDSLGVSFDHGSQHPVYEYMEGEIDGPK